MGDTLLGSFLSCETDPLHCSDLCTLALTEKEIVGKHSVVRCIRTVDNKCLQSYALVDWGATGFGFIDKTFVSHQCLSMKQLARPRFLEVVDGRPI